MNEILEAKNISAAYIKRDVLSDVSIKVNEGEIVALIGPNGAGKSTLLKVILGILKPKNGSVLFKGEDITKLEAFKRIQKGIGYFIQGGEIFRNLTVEENILLGLFYNKNKEIFFKKEDIYNLFPNLYKKRQMIAGLLSGGEKQALALSIVLITQPKILLLDEPSAGLAPNLVKDILEKIKVINEKYGISFLVVEQNVKEILDIAHRVYIMKFGKIFSENTPKEILETDILDKAFLG